MSRLLRLGLRAYPHDVRERDGAYLLDLATELAAESGSGRQAWSLLTGGLRARLRSARRPAVAVGAAAALLLGGAGAAFATGDHQVEVQTCVGTTEECTALESWVAQQERRGWSCERADGDGVSWRCVAP